MGGVSQSLEQRTVTTKLKKNNFEPNTLLTEICAYCCIPDFNRFPIDVAVLQHWNHPVLERNKHQYNDAPICSFKLLVHNGQFLTLHHDSVSLAMSIQKSCQSLLRANFVTCLVLILQRASKNYTPDRSQWIACGFIHCLGDQVLFKAFFCRFKWLFTIILTLK